MLSYHEKQKLEKAATRMMTAAQKRASEERHAAVMAEREADWRRRKIETLEHAEEELAKALERKVDDAHRSLVKFRADFDKNAAYALRCAGSELFEAAATVDVYTTIAQALRKSVAGEPDHKATVETVAAWVLDQAERAAQQRHESTNPTSNLYEAAVGRVYADLAFEKFGRLHVGDNWSRLGGFAEAVKKFRAGDVEGAIA